MIIWGKKDIYTKKILLNILEEQLQLDDLAINNLFLENFIENKGYFVDGALKKKYIDYVICLKLVLVLVRYQLFEEAYQLFSNVEKVFPNNSLQLGYALPINLLVVAIFGMLMLVGILVNSMVFKVTIGIMVVCLIGWNLYVYKTLSCLKNK